MELGGTIAVRPPHNGGGAPPIANFAPLIANSMGGALFYYDSYKKSPKSVIVGSIFEKFRLRRTCFLTSSSSTSHTMIFNVNLCIFCWCVSNVGSYLPKYCISKYGGSRPSLDFKNWGLKPKIFKYFFKIFNIF